MKLNKLNWQENVPLKDLTTFRVGGRARYFARVESEKELLSALQRAKKINCSTFILGGGSNLLFPDKGHPGLIIQMAIKSVKWRDNEVEVGSGVALGWLVKESVRRGLSGLEWEAAVPGTVGGAVCGNAGTPDHSIGQLVWQVRCFNRDNSKFENLSSEECFFGYRDSVFRHHSNRIITSVTLRESFGNPDDIRECLCDWIKKRVSTQPRLQPSAGCVFKNPPGNFAGALIDRVGLKGRRIGNAEISSQHANFIVNLGGARSEEILALIQLAKSRVKDEFGITLEEEIIIVPDQDSARH